MSDYNVQVLQYTDIDVIKKAIREMLQSNDW